MVINPVHLVIGVVVFVCLFWIARWGLAEMGAPPTVTKVVLVLLGVIAFVWLLGALGITAPVLRVG